MMRRRVVIPALILTSLAAVPATGFAQYGDAKSPPVADAATQRFSATQLDNLAGPVALYPDALLAQVLIAATFPEQVQDAADFVKAYGTDSVDVQSWDVSVKAVAHYPSALNSMADKIDWTSALGRAYATQSSDVMASVQRLRRMAADQGNLNSTPQQNVVHTNETYQIVPVEPRVIYVPVYDPYVIYSRPIFNIGYTSRYWSWGIGFPIGSWLIYDCDWGLRRVYYNGWSPTYYGFGGGWRQRSRPFIQVTNIYINPRYTNVYVNRNVVYRSVNYYNVDRYASVHSGRYFNDRRDGRYDARDNGRPDNRYAVRNDGNNGNGGSAVRGGGYRQGNDNGGNNNRNTPRDGSGYGGRDDVNRGGNGSNGSVNNGGNRDGNGNYTNRGDGNGNRDGGNRGADNRGGDNRGGNNGGANNGGVNNGNNSGNNGNDARDGNGNRVRQANPRGTPPQGRRNEPAARNDMQLSVPSQTDQPRAQPRPQERPQGSGRFSVPDAPRQSAPQERRAEPRVAQPQVSRPPESRGPAEVRSGDSRGSESRGGDSRGGERSARPRGGNS